MTENKRFNVDVFIQDNNCGFQDLEGNVCEIEDNGKPMTYKEVCDLLNKLYDENKRFTIESERINNAYSIHIYKNNKVIFEISNWGGLSELHKKECEELVNLLNQLNDENEQLKKEKEFWKSDACSLSSLNSILSNELSIAQEQGYEPSKPYKEYIASIKTEYSKFWENKIKTYNNQIKRSYKNDL